MLLTFFSYYLIFGIYSLIFTIIKILLILSILESIIESASSNLLREINYILVGFGVAADLGIIGEIFVLLVSVILIALDIYSKVTEIKI
jgi:hypothetical protein